MVEEKCEIKINQNIFRSYTIDEKPEDILNIIDPDTFQKKYTRIEATINSIDNFIKNVKQLMEKIPEKIEFGDKLWYTGEIQLKVGTNNIYIEYPNKWSIVRLEELINKLEELKQKSIEILKKTDELKKHYLDIGIWVCKPVSSSSSSEEEDP